MKIKSWPEAQLWSFQQHLSPTKRPQPANEIGQNTTEEKCHADGDNDEDSIELLANTPISRHLRSDGVEGVDGDDGLPLGVGMVTGPFEGVHISTTVISFLVNVPVSIQVFS